MVLPVSNSTSNGGVVLFLHILASMCCHLSFYLSHSDWRKVESQCCFDLYFLISKDFEHFFWSFSAFHICSIVNSLFRYLPQFLIGLFGFLVVNFLCLLYIFDISPLSSVGIEKIFFPICRLPLCPIYYVLCLTKFSSFLRSHLSIPDLRAWAIGVFLGNSPCDSKFEALSHFIFYFLDCVLFYVEVLDPLELELCARWQIWIYFHFPTCRLPVRPALVIEDVFFFPIFEWLIFMLVSPHVHNYVKMSFTTSVLLLNFSKYLSHLTYVQVSFLTVLALTLAL